MNNLAMAITIGFPVLFILFAVLNRKTKTVKGYFHIQDDLAWTISLVAANVTLGTGIAYYFSLSNQLGLWALLSPLFVFFSYYLFSYLAKIRRHVLIDSDSSNFLYWLQKVSSDQLKANTKLVSLLPSLALILTFTLLLAFELYASSQILTSIIFDEADQKAGIFKIAVGLSLIVILYSVLGGINTVLKSDKIQILGVLIILVAIMIPILSTTSSDSAIKLKSLSNLETWTLSAAIIGAIATQFYSLLNWGALTNFSDGGNPEKVLKWTGFITAIILSLFILGGFLISSPDQSPVSFSGNIISHYQNIESPIFIYIILIGMLGILISTIDSLVLQLSLFSYENFFNLKSSDVSSEKSVTKIRLVSAFVFILTSFFLLSFIHYSFNLIFLLFAIAGGVVVYAPFMFLAFLLSGKKENLRIFNNKVAITYFSIFFGATTVNAISLTQKPELASHVIVISFLISSLLSVYLWFSVDNK